MTEPATSSSDRERGPGEVFCRNCGQVISERAEICPNCGVRQLPPPKSSLDSALDDLVGGGNPFVAAVLSAIFPGLGQLYNRELERGLAFIVVSMLALLSSLVLIGFVLYPLVWIYSIYDAYTRAELRAEAADEGAATGIDERADEGTAVPVASPGTEPESESKSEKPESEEAESDEVETNDRREH